MNSRYRLWQQKALTRGTLFLLLLAPSLAGAAPFANTLSMQGYSGLLNTPNAEVVEEGHIILSYSDQKNVEWPAKVPRGENYFFNVGLFSIVELGGRLTEAPGLMRDLSANVKVKVPFIPKGYYLPDVAFGLGDAGGGASHFRTKYVVATETLGPLRGSVGYGTGPDRLKGVFAGAELKAHDWVYLIAERDTRDTNAGVKVITPPLFGRDVKMQLTAKTAVSRNPGTVDLAFSLEFPLSLSREEVRRKHEGQGGGAKAAAQGEQGGAQPSSTGKPQGEGSAPREKGLYEVQERLTSVGLQGVRVGAEGKSVVIEYENSIFNHNEMDALGVVLGSAADLLEGEYERIFVVIRHKGLQVMTLCVPFSDVRDFFSGASDKLKSSLTTNDDLPAGGVSFVAGKTISPYFKPTLILWPGLTTFVGTEVGLFDYILSLKADLLFTPWKGAVTEIRGDFPLSWSENLEDGKIYRRARRGNRLERVMQFQALKITPSLSAMLGAGKIIEDTYGTVNELMWTSPEGRHRLRLKQAYAEDSVAKVKRQTYLGSYRYYYSPLNLFVEGTAGRFWERDTGGTLEMKRFFGDTTFSVYYKNSKTFEGKHWQVGGVQVAFPLTFRKDMKPAVAQVRGTEEWSYSQETVISTGGPNSVLQTALGINPEPSVNLQNVYFNRDRLNRAYLTENLDRLTEAYRKYGRK